MFTREGCFKVMSINAINSVSLYEYYYTINNKEEEKKKSSPLESEMRKYGLTPTDNETLNIALLNQAKRLERSNEQEQKEASPSDRPWADLMYQLNISFNEDPAQDIQDIKDEVAKLVRGFDDEELQKEVLDLEDYAEQLYISYQQNSSGSINTSDLLGSQLSNLSMLNRANFI